jgi:hypothetical protein
MRIGQLEPQHSDRQPYPRPPRLSGVEFPTILQMSPIPIQRLQNRPVVKKFRNIPKQKVLLGLVPQFAITVNSN